MATRGRKRRMVGGLPPDWENFRKRLNQAHDESGLTGMAVAERLGVSDSTINRYLNGGRAPDPEMIQQLADVYGKPVEWFFQAPDDTTEERIQELIKKARVDACFEMVRRINGGQEPLDALRAMIS